jgi:hypothetical protein
VKYLLDTDAEREVTMDFIDIAVELRKRAGHPSNEGGMFSRLSCVRWGAGLASLLLAGLTFGRSAEDTPVMPLPQAHAHNDYEHARPLLDALEHGFCSVEADIFLMDGELLVGHTRKDLRPGRTLEKLYLEPLRQRAKANGGRVYRGGPTVYLLIDVKSDSKPTYAALAPVLARYADILSVTKGGKFEPRAVTVVISGNCDRAAITAQKPRYAGIDGRPADLDSEAPADLMPWVSASWGSVFRWRGEGPMPAAERTKLREFVAKAHRRGRLVRFWATPEDPVVWGELLTTGVDLINTDKLAQLRRFLLDNRAVGPVRERNP